MKLDVGASVDGRFRLVQRLGQGGFACVWLAVDTHSPKDAPVALKIARAFEVFDRPEIALYTMEYIGGRTLKNDIERRVHQKTSYETAELVEIVESLARARSTSRTPATSRTATSSPPT